MTLTGKRDTGVWLVYDQWGGLFATAPTCAQALPVAQSIGGRALPGGAKLR